VLPSPGSFELKTQVEQLERAAILKALEATGGSRREAADLLGVSLRTLFYKLRRYQLD
jgi:DNA-binding NtrC family response regulator